MKDLRIVLSMALVLAILSACNDDDEVVPAKSKTTTKPAPTPTPTPTPQGETSPEGIVAVYDVNGDELTLTKEYSVSSAYAIYANKEKHKEVWNYFTKLIPASARPQLKRLVLVADDNADYAAYVAPTDVNAEDLSSWEMGLNFTALYIDGFMDKPETGYTMIHEFGHLLTLHAGQIDSKTTEASCASFFTGEGCTKSNSYLMSFFDNFWKDIYAELTQSQSSSQNLYEKYRNRFVTSYAASNPGEDIAESFTHFVLKMDLASGSTMADGKINSFYDYTEASSIRNEIRKNLDFEYNLSNARTIQKRAKRICRHQSK